MSKFVRTAVLSAAAMLLLDGVAADRITLPEERREFAAPSGNYVLVVSTRDGWKSGRGIGELYAVAPVRKLLWRRDLPQQFGPRFALVNDAGASLMLDEWINVRTAYAVLIIDSDGRTVAQRSTDEVQAALQLPMSELVKKASYGWWIGAPPTLDSGGGAVHVATAGKVLTIRLTDGALSAR